MPRGQSRKGIITRGRTENGVTLSADGERKAGETAKLEIQTDCVKQAERGVAMGSAQLQKPKDDGSNNGSGIGQLVRHKHESYSMLFLNWAYPYSAHHSKH